MQYKSNNPVIKIVIGAFTSSKVDETIVASS